MIINGEHNKGVRYCQALISPIKSTLIQNMKMIAVWVIDTDKKIAKAEETSFSRK